MNPSYDGKYYKPGSISVLWSHHTTQTHNKLSTEICCFKNVPGFSLLKVAHYLPSKEDLGGSRIDSFYTCNITSFIVPKDIQCRDNILPNIQNISSNAELNTTNVMLSAMSSCLCVTVVMWRPLIYDMQYPCTNVTSHFYRHLVAPGE